MPGGRYQAGHRARPRKVARHQPPILGSSARSLHRPTAMRLSVCPTNSQSTSAPIPAMVISRSPPFRLALDQPAVIANVGFGSLADTRVQIGDVRFTPQERTCPVPMSAKCHCRTSRHWPASLLCWSSRAKPTSVVRMRFLIDFPLVLTPMLEILPGRVIVGELSLSRVSATAVSGS